MGVGNKESVLQQARQEEIVVEKQKVRKAGMRHTSFDRQR